MNLELIGITTPLTTPVDNMTGLLPDFKAVNLSGSELKIALEGNVEENDVLVVQITPLSVGQSTNINGLRQVGTVAGEPPRLSSPKSTPHNSELLPSVTKYRYKSMPSTL